MINKSLTRRLERLEEEINPGESDILVLQVVGVNPDGTHVNGPEFKVEIPPRPVKQRPR